jgi:hypothetical protein
MRGERPPHCPEAVAVLTTEDWRPLFWHIFQKTASMLPRDAHFAETLSWTLSPAGFQYTTAVAANLPIYKHLCLLNSSLQFRFCLSGKSVKALPISLIILPSRKFDGSKYQLYGLAGITAGAA